MKILPILQNNLLINNNKNTINSINNQYQYPQFNMPVLKPLECDTVSFSGRRGPAPFAEPLRALMRYGVYDMYSDIILIPHDIIKELDAKRIFAKPIKYITKMRLQFEPVNGRQKTLIPLESCLLKVEREFFKVVKSMAKTNPEYTLSDVIRRITPEHNKKLLAIQQPIFDELTEMAKEMPVEELAQFHEMMDLVYKRLNCQPVKLPFNAKEFQYKLQRIADKLNQSGKVTEYVLMQQIISMAKRMPSRDANTKNINSVSKAKRNKKIKQDKSIIRKRADLLTQIEMTAYGSLLKNNKELSTLLSQTRARIYGMPSIIPFQRKTFIEELQTITDKLENRELAQKMVQKAAELPTSHDVLSAFVIKYHDCTSEEIGFNMVYESEGCIDHLVAASKNGRDGLDNYGMCSRYHNSERADRPISKQLQLFPRSYRYCQRQVDRLVELYNRGVFRRVGLRKNYIPIFVKNMYTLSPGDNRLVLKTDRLR